MFSSASHPSGPKKQPSTTFSISLPVTKRPRASAVRPVLNSASEKKDKPFLTFLEGFAKVATPLIAGVGIWAGIWQFQEQQTFNESQEFKRKMWDKKLSAYTSLADVTSQLMTSSGGPEFDSLGRRFQRICYSSTPLFDSVAVMRMESFDEEVKSVLNDEGGDMSILRERGRNMLKSCQLSIDSSYIRANRSSFSLFKWN